MVLMGIVMNWVVVTVYFVLITCDSRRTVTHQHLIYSVN